MSNPPLREEPALAPKELSQLAFNARVLQEAQDKSVPLLERLRFLGIFSSNQDEYYRVRVATIQRLERLGSRGAALLGSSPAELLEAIQGRILDDQAVFLETYEKLLRELEENGIHIVTESDLNRRQRRFVAEFFEREVRPHLTPILLQETPRRLVLSERDIYLGVRVERGENRDPIYAIVDVPTRVLTRFVRLPTQRKQSAFILLEDVIRFGLADVFSVFGPERAEGFVVKLTRDAELDLDGHPKESYLTKVEKSISRRRTADLVRFVYDENMPEDLLHALRKNLDVDESTSLVPGGRHHNFKDFIDFPDLDPNLRYTPEEPLPLPDIDSRKTVLSAVRRGDILLHTPYQRFSYLIDLLREAAIDPKVTRIAVTLYRVATNSSIVRALIGAARNGKRVTAVVELTARFDEAVNIGFTERLVREGVRVVFGPEDLKVHAKLGLIERREHGRKALYGLLGTGNMNENTGRLYTDHFLLTTHRGLCEDIATLFRIIRHPYEDRRFRHLLVAPWTLRSSIEERIEAEAERARNREPAFIDVKLNNLTHPETMRRLLAAAEAGVRVRLNVRGALALPTEEKRIPSRLKAIGLIDRRLEHSRFFTFGNGGQPLTFVASADWMPRNFERRIEIAFPVFEPRHQEALRQYFEIQWADNTKARLHDPRGRNRRVRRTGRARRAQSELHDWLARSSEETSVAVSPSPASSLS